MSIRHSYQNAETLILADVEWELLFTDEYESKDYTNIRWSISSGLEKKTTRKKNGVNKVLTEQNTLLKQHNCWNQ